MFEVTERNGGRRSIVATFPAMAEALDYVRGLGVVTLEMDPDHEGCADAFTRSGIVLAIQPQGFVL